MTVAGARYRAVLAERPDDQVAARMTGRGGEAGDRLRARLHAPHPSPRGESHLEAAAHGRVLLFGAAGVWAVFQLVRLLRARF